jgi:glycosyltransferase involved in cell wall biosynthesis
VSHPLYFQWGVSSLFGWGVSGLNLLYLWPKISGAPAYGGAQIHLESFAGMDPLRLRTLAPLLVESDRMRQQMSPATGPTPIFDGIVIHSMGNRFSGSAAPGMQYLTGRLTTVKMVFEDTILPDAVAACSRFPVIVTCSTWNEQVLRANGVNNVVTAFEGMDPSLFHPAPRWGGLSNRFTVFSAGKLEYRKAQDLVLLAFRAFAQRHPEAMLVTAWNSPFEGAALSLNRNPLIAPMTVDDKGKVNFAAWAAANGIREDQFIDVGGIPNHFMARIYREMDVALLPNRCEGGTNMMAMECMACGVPMIISDNTGHRDLIATGAPHPLTRQVPVEVSGTGTEGWGECDVEEIVEALEWAYNKREEAVRRGAAGAAAMANWTWARHAARLYSALTPLCS